MNNEQNPIKVIAWAVGGIVIVILIISLLPFVVVGAGERGVVTKFGKVQDYILNEGFHFLTPFQDHVTKIDVKVQKSETTAQAASRDLQTVTTKIVVNYHLNADRVNKIFQTIGDEKAVEDRIITPNVNEVVKAASAQRTAEELLTKRALLKFDIDTGLTERLKGYNIIVDDVSVTDLDFSPEFNQAIERKAQAEQDALAEKNKLEQVKYKAQQTIEEAKAKAESIKIQGDALRENPELVNLKAVEQWNGILPVNMYGSVPLPFININQ